MHPRKHTLTHTGMRNGPAYVHADSSACARMHEHARTPLLAAPRAFVHVRTLMHVFARERAHMFVHGWVRRNARARTRTQMGTHANTRTRGEEVYSPACAPARVF